MSEQKVKSDVNRTVFIQPTTGGQIEVRLSPESTVTNLKRAVANRLKVPKEKIVLLHKNRQLTDGSLQDNHVIEGARLTLLPSVETGLMAQKPEQCVMQALETLNETQVDNFLTGKAPLNLSMRLGDHMMFIQLQLSTIGAKESSSSSSAPASPSLTPPSTPTSPSVPLRFPTPSAQISVPPSPPPSPKMASADPPSVSARTKLNSRALAEASRNLSQTLRQLSSAALSKKMNESCDGRCGAARKDGGAVIESMFHHGRGIYSGTFSGTLSPLLQDPDGRPRRDISTIIHILNDLLGASSHCRPSAQCLCSPQSPQTQEKKVCSAKVKVEGEQKQEENKVLKEKVEQIQTMLEERRQKRKARRDVRSAPYPTTSTMVIRDTSRANELDTSTLCSSLGNSSLAPECNDQIMADYSSEAAVA